MDYQRLFILIAIIVVMITVSNANFDLGGFQIGGGDRIYPMIDDMFARRNSCYDRYTVRWQPDPNNFKENLIKSNPFAKSNNAHCRQDSQCKSGSCKDWYCSPNEPSN